MIQQSLFVFTLSCLVFCGCNRHPVVQDSAKLVVWPGQGITNLCALGMSFRQVRDATQDGSSYGLYDDRWSYRYFTGSRYALIQSLGAIAPIGDNQKLEIITFYVVPTTSGSYVRGMDVTNPFRGRVGNNLSFNAGVVGRHEVELQCGTIDRVITNNSDAGSLARAGIPYLLQGLDGDEKINYPRQGIGFDLASNTVLSFTVYRPLTNR